MPTTIPYPPEVPTSADELPVTGPGSLPTLWLRAGAKLFDQLIIQVPLLALSVPYMNLTDPEATTLDFPDWLRITLVVVPMLVEFVFLAWRAATPGKMLLGMTVCSYVDGGGLSIHQCGLRALVPGLGGVAGLLVVSANGRSLLDLWEPIVYLFAVYHPLRRGLHDRAAGTIVLRNR